MAQSSNTFAQRAEQLKYNAEREGIIVGVGEQLTSRPI